MADTCPQCGRYDYRNVHNLVSCSICTLRATDIIGGRNTRTDEQGMYNPLEYKEKRDMVEDRAVGFTPGQWICSNSKDSWGDDVIDILADSGQRIAFDIDNIHNAHLIASAPELLEVCTRALNELACAPADNPIDKELFNDLQEAVAKAEGRK